GYAVPSRVVEHEPPQHRLFRLQRVGRQLQDVDLRILNDLGNGLGHGALGSEGRSLFYRRTRGGSLYSQRRADRTNKKGPAYASPLFHCVAARRLIARQAPTP